jgi:hypothetical protein
MNSVFIKITNQLVRKPKMLFLIDSLGALLTALLLGVLRNLEDYFVMPKTTLSFLSAIAACFCFYSAACFLLLNRKMDTFYKNNKCCQLTLLCIDLGIFICSLYPTDNSRTDLFFSGNSNYLCTCSF